MFWGSAPRPLSPTCDGCTPGDWTRDGVVNGGDIQGLVAIWIDADTSPTSFGAADVDGNGVIIESSAEL